MDLWICLKAHCNTNKSGLKNKINDVDKRILDISGLIQNQIMMQRLLRLKAIYLVTLT